MSAQLISVATMARLFSVLLLVASLQACVSPGTLANKPPGLSAASQELFALIDQAEEAYRSNRWKDATSLYQKVLVKVPEDPYVWFRLGNTLTQQQQYNQAIYAYEASLQRDARQSKPWINLSTTYLLGAQLATLRAWEAMGENDPARATVSERLNTLSRLLQ